MQAMKGFIPGNIADGALKIRISLFYCLDVTTVIEQNSLATIREAHRTKDIFPSRPGGKIIKVIFSSFCSHVVPDSKNRYCLMPRGTRHPQIHAGFLLEFCSPSTKLDRGTWRKKPAYWRQFTIVMVK